MDNYDHGIIGNCTTAALISRDCSVEWLCMPFFDSPSLFASILDPGKGGYFRISAEDTTHILQSYIPDTPILKTRVTTRDGIFEVRDYMPRFVDPGGKYYCPSELHREILLVSGMPRVRIELCPRPNYGLTEAVFIEKDEYIKITSKEGEYNSFYLYTDIDKQKVISGDEFVLSDKRFLVLSYHEKLRSMERGRIFLEYEKTKTYWLDWAYRKVLPESRKEMVTRSLITLKLLMFQRSGAVIAAPTTSLPEIIGRERNWDYRFCWMRDAAMMVDIYLRVGDVSSANRFIRFILDRMLLKNDEIAIMYGINGEKHLHEVELDHLEGYMSSKPVRIGNAAYTQVQNDVYGELIETIYTYFIHGHATDVDFNEEIWTAVRTLARKVQKIWRDPDAGIWEKRGPKQHHVHSKLMCWVAMDRAAKIAQHIGKDDYVDQWADTADVIKKDILDNGWNEDLGAFPMYYGSKAMDASNLLMLHYEFLPPDDPVMVSTVRKSYEVLVRDGLTFRYVDDDDFGEPENAFIVCTFWMINALYLIGDRKRARKMFDLMVSCTNPLGLLSEDVEINSKRLTGNFPQGYSHLALIQTAMLFGSDYSWSDADPEPDTEDMDPARRT